MKGLVLDTTLKEGYVVAFDGDREVVHYLDPSLSTQSALIPACKAALSELSITTKDLEGIVAVVGPGSFTGIRIGVTFANAMAFALGLPRYAVTSFELMQAIRPEAPAFSIEAGHDSFYVAVADKGSLLQKNMDKAELPVGTVAQSELKNELSRGALLVAKKAFEERAYSACAPTHETDLLKPNYMRKSQAERLKEEKK